jgi:hypothetical protein
MQTDSVIIACKTYEQAAIVHRDGAALRGWLLKAQLVGDVTWQDTIVPLTISNVAKLMRRGALHATGRSQHGRVMGRDAPRIVQDIICLLLGYRALIAE